MLTGRPREVAEMEVAEMKINTAQREIRRAIKNVFFRLLRDRHCVLANISYTSEHAITSGWKQLNNIE